MIIALDPFLRYRICDSSSAQAMESVNAYHGSPPQSPLPPADGDPPAGLTPEEYESLQSTIDAHHRYHLSTGQCSSLISQRIRAPAATVWSVVRRFDRPQIYKHFIRSSAIMDGGEVRIGSLREVRVISGLPASTSTERLDILDEEQRVTGFTIIGGEHRLTNYRSVTSVTEFGESDRESGGGLWTVVLESYIVDVPEGNTEEDTRLFADTVVRLNLQKLATVTESMAAAAAVSEKGK
ncbi:abscisic acid receptor PYR1-like [Dendrobium catenatum]|uniref:Abscisic acid receptor PYR1 n=2 Tax=Dendrobium TaxID=37818 RepID=A0A2I0WBR0_9ASPA|nr:abscisic acid receptor PYR1-like [Dendrobium catenatum]PKU73100.1 Abscisic acid receptor PYR1 [Dendrobium catenatum]